LGGALLSVLLTVIAAITGAQITGCIPWQLCCHGMVFWAATTSQKISHNFESRYLDLKRGRSLALLFLPFSCEEARIVALPELHRI
jgi:hypothetical protein